MEFGSPAPVWASGCGIRLWGLEQEARARRHPERRCPGQVTGVGKTIAWPRGPFLSVTTGSERRQWSFLLRGSSRGYAFAACARCGQWAWNGVDPEPGPVPTRLGRVSGVQVDCRTCWLPSAAFATASPSRSGDGWISVRAPSRCSPKDMLVLAVSPGLADRSTSASHSLTPTSS